MGPVFLYTEPKPFPIWKYPRDSHNEKQLYYMAHPCLPLCVTTINYTSKTTHVHSFSPLLKGSCLSGILVGYTLNSSRNHWFFLKWERDPTHFFLLSERPYSLVVLSQINQYQALFIYLFLFFSPCISLSGLHLHTLYFLLSMRATINVNKKRSVGTPTSELS